MTPVMCSGPECDRPAVRKGLCLQHRRQLLRGEDLRPVRRQRFQNKGKTCSFGECSRPAQARGLCASHYDLARKGRPLREIGTYPRSQAMRAYWASLPPEEVARRTRALMTGYERTDDHDRMVSESQRRRWARGMTFKPKVCVGCGKTFDPHSGRQVFCTKECHRLSARARRYGMRREELAELVDRQGGLCALCGRTDYGFFHGQPLVVDHCHTTGRVRGLLCGDCNTAIGRFGDDPARLRRAAEYLDATP